MTDADKRLCREMFDVVAPAGAADFRKRAIAELRFFAKQHRACQAFAAEELLLNAIRLIEQLPLTVTP